MSEDERIAALLQRDAIREVVVRYFDAVRRRDWPAVLACFVPGAYADYGFDAERTIEAQLALVQRGIRRFPVSTFLGSNCSVTLRDGAAESDTLALTAHEAPPESGERTRLSAVRYRDEWIQPSGARWCIRRRVIETLWRAWLEPRHDDRAGDHRHADEW